MVCSPRHIGEIALGGETIAVDLTQRLRHVPPFVRDIRVTPQFVDPGMPVCVTCRVEAQRTRTLGAITAGKHPGPVTNEVWKYDVAADSWTVGTPLPEPRAGGGLAIVGRNLHYFGGYKADRDTNAGEHWSLPLDGGTAWKHEAELPDPRGHVSTAVLEGKMYALGGDHGHDKTQIDVSSCHRFDPATNKWSEIASLPDGRSHFESSTIIHQGRILIVGGRCNSSQPPRGVMNDLLEYDSKSDRWQVVGTMPEKLLAPSAEIVSGRIVVTGGGLNNPRPLTAKTWMAPVPAGH